MSAAYDTLAKDLRASLEAEATAVAEGIVAEERAACAATVAEERAARIAAEQATALMSQKVSMLEAQLKDGVASRTRLESALSDMETRIKAAIPDFSMPAIHESPDYRPQIEAMNKAVDMANRNMAIVNKQVTEMLLQKPSPSKYTFEITGKFPDGRAKVIVARPQ